MLVPHSFAPPHLRYDVSSISTQTEAPGAKGKFVRREKRFRKPSMGIKQQLPVYWLITMLYHMDILWTTVCRSLTHPKFGQNTCFCYSCWNGFVILRLIRFYVFFLCLCLVSRKRPNRSSSDILFIIIIIKYTLQL